MRVKINIFAKRFEETFAKNKSLEKSAISSGSDKVSSLHQIS